MPSVTGIFSKPVSEVILEFDFNRDGTSNFAMMIMETLGVIPKHTQVEAWDRNPALSAAVLEIRCHFVRSLEWRG